ncbi:MAG: hypothetical protein ACI4T3_03515 [Lactobacillus sp.]
MKLEVMLQDKERESKYEQAIKDLKKSANRMKQFGIDDATAFQALKEDYHDELSDEEIRKLMNETK